MEQEPSNESNEVLRNVELTEEQCETLLSLLRVDMDRLNSSKERLAEEDPDRQDLHSFDEAINFYEVLIEKFSAK